MLKKFNLKSIFIVEEEEETKPAKAAVPKAKTKAAPKTAPRPTSAPSGPARAGKVTPKFTDILLTAMEKANLDGFDYLEYKKSLQSLQKMNMVEETAFQSAYAMAQTMGATPDHLVKTAQHYLQALLAEEQKFEGALANQQQNRIGAKKQEQQQLQETIKSKEAQIKQLQDEIVQHQQKLGKLDKEIGSAVSSIETTKNDFLVSYQHLVSQIQSDVEKMQKYLK